MYATGQMQSGVDADLPLESDCTETSTWNTGQCRAVPDQSIFAHAYEVIRD